jgi:WD40 repeat protein
LTRVWDLTNGEQVLSLSHGETVKSLSLAFKPGNGLEEEGKRIWLGTSAGELHEVDIASQSIVASRSYPSRREVIQILRHKKEMWTIDDEGRLLVWLPDETGVPNLQYSYHSPHERVARGQFSMVVDDKLWLAAGKDVYIYRPSARDDAVFKVLKRPLGLQHSGDVTCGTYTTHEGGRVYLGHADGKVTVYSSTDYACLAVVNVSVYKINCLDFVGDYLWAGYKTGMIYVYDTRTNPWTVKKDWRAHDSPVCGFVLDTSSVWTINRLQVTSLGTDNCIRLWDGMLEDDWLGMFLCLVIPVGNRSNLKQTLGCKREMWNFANSANYVPPSLRGTLVLPPPAVCARRILSEMPSNLTTLPISWCLDFKNLLILKTRKSQRVHISRNLL